MLRNTDGQFFHVKAFNASGLVSGAAAAITSTLSIDGDTRSALTDVNPVEIGSTGEYVFDLTQAETDGHELSFVPVCSTAGVQVLGMPSNVIYTFDADAIAADIITGLRPGASSLNGGIALPTTDTIRLIQRDDYLAAQGRAFEWTITDPAIDFTSDSAVVVGAAAAGQTPGVPVIVGTPSLHNRANGSCTLRVEFTSANLNRPASTYQFNALVLVDAKRVTKLSLAVILLPQFADAP